MHMYSASSFENRHSGAHSVYTSLHLKAFSNKMSSYWIGVTCNSYLKFCTSIPVLARASFVLYISKRWFLSSCHNDSMIPVLSRACLFFRYRRGTKKEMADLLGKCFSNHAVARFRIPFESEAFMNVARTFIIKVGPFEPIISVYLYIWMLYWDIVHISPTFFEYSNVGIQPAHVVLQRCTGYLINEEQNEDRSMSSTGRRLRRRPLIRCWRPFPRLWFGQTTQYSIAVLLFSCLACLFGQGL